MKILQLCKKIPYPLKDGESIAIHYLSKGLVEQGCEVSLLAINTLKHHYELREIPEELAHYSVIKHHTVDTNVKAWDAFINLFSDSSYNIDRFDDEAFRQLLAETLEENTFDIVQLETLYMAPYISTIRKFSSAKICMRSHNMEHEIWKNLASQESSFLKSKYYDLCAARLEDYESSTQGEYDILLPISDKDYEYYARSFKGNMQLATVGLDMNKYKFSPPESFNTELKLGYIGSLDWKPNIEGLDWFFYSCWEELLDKDSNFKFHLAGRNGSPKYDDLKYSNVLFHGEVDDSISFLESLDIVVVPLFSGSGIRVKILEAMALGKTVLSTPKGFEGISIQSGENAMIFETKEELVDLISDLNHDKVQMKRIAQNARVTVLENFSYQSIASEVKDLFQKSV